MTGAVCVGAGIVGFLLFCIFMYAVLYVASGADAHLGE